MTVQVAQQMGEVLEKTGPAALPGIVTVLASWAGLLQAGLTIAFLLLSIAFMAWRWMVQRKDRQRDESSRDRKDDTAWIDDKADG